MYPQVNTNEEMSSGKQMPTAPPTYTETVSAHKYEYNPQQAYPSYPPPPTHSAMGSQVPTQVIVVQAPAIPPLGPQPVQVNCPACKSCVLTTVEEESSNTAYICCMLLFVVGCFLCSCVPFCMDNFKNYKHTCPRCNAFIGQFQP